MKHGRAARQHLVCPTTPERSRLMGRVRRNGTAPELELRSALRTAGLRFRAKSSAKLPGTPDIVLPQMRIAIFVDGCFWHGCPKHGTVPKTNSSFWLAKIRRNKQRDRSASRLLRKLGWRTIRVWEHEVRRDVLRVIRRIERLLIRL